nr:protein translation factor SUI1 homolog [Populus alba]
MGVDFGRFLKRNDYVHVRVQQRNGRKSLTTVLGLKKEYSYSKILKDLKKEFCCNGTVVQDPDLGQFCTYPCGFKNFLERSFNFWVIKGRTFPPSSFRVLGIFGSAINGTFSLALCEQSGIAKKENIKIHGF